MKVKGKGRPKGALGKGILRVVPSSTQRDPLFFELPLSSAPPALPLLVQQPFVVRNRPLSTALAIQRLTKGH